MTCGGCKEGGGTIEPNGYHASCSHKYKVCKSYLCKRVLGGY